MNSPARMHDRAPENGLLYEVERGDKQECNLMIPIFQGNPIAKIPPPLASGVSGVRLREVKIDSSDDKTCISSPPKNAHARQEFESSVGSPLHFLFLPTRRRKRLND